MQVPEPVKDARLQALQALLREQQADFNRGTENLVLPVLLTGAGRKPGQLSGRSPYLQPVHLEGPESLIGQVCPVRILAGNPNSLTATLDTEQSAA
jgi:tRNA-2-methylthio-N6-dimethylallyladenosine synthase